MALLSRASLGWNLLKGWCNENNRPCLMYDALKQKYCIIIFRHIWKNIKDDAIKQNYWITFCGLGWAGLAFWQDFHNVFFIMLPKTNFYNCTDEQLKTSNSNVFLFRIDKRVDWILLVDERYYKENLIVSIFNGTLL